MFRNIFALLGGTIVLVLGFTFSLVLFAVLAVVGLGVWGYVMWKTRELRRVMREQAEAQARGMGGMGGMGEAREDGRGHVIEGEAVVVEEYHVKTTKPLPGDRPENS
jgi:membrane protein implicated in regulation of membrane protease activity